MSGSLSASAPAGVELTVDFNQPIAIGSPLVFGATQPRGLSEQQWDLLPRQGFTFARSQADLTALVPAGSPEDYHQNRDGCADPANWNWTAGIYGEDFVQRALARGLEVCLVIKNATWNRHLGAPIDEETMPRDLEVWADILRKIVEHYEGRIAFIELYNEVDRAPQFLVDGSTHDRRSGYLTTVRAALRAIRGSRYPETLIGGPAAAGAGLEQAAWLLEDPEIRSGLGFLSFHAFGAEHYPADIVPRYRELMARHGVDLPIVRSSFVPKYRRQPPTFEPGTLDPLAIAPHLIGALQDGLAAAGLWEIQNKEGADDVRYWFDGEDTVPTSGLWELMSNRLRLGHGGSTVVAVQGGEPHHLLGAINAAGESVAVVVSKSDQSQRLTLRLHPAPGRPVSSRVRVLRLESASGEVHELAPVAAAREGGVIVMEVELAARSVTGFILGDADPARPTR